MSTDLLYHPTMTHHHTSSSTLSLPSCQLMAGAASCSQQGCRSSPSALRGLL